MIRYYEILGIAAAASPNSTLNRATKQVLLANWLTSGGAAQSFWIEPPRTTQTEGAPGVFGASWHLGEFSDGVVLGFVVGHALVSCEMLL